MRRQEIWVWAAVVVTLALFVVCSFLPVYAMWGINHLAFLETGVSAVFLLALVISLAAVLFVPVKRLDHMLDQTAELLWNRGIIPQAIVVVVLVALFYALRTEQYLLGDGATLLAAYGQGESFPDKWTELGSIYLLRGVQWLLGDYTRETALTAFRVLSIGSAVAYILASIRLAGRISGESRVRLLTLAALLFSGATLLFFGYVEFYALPWAISALTLLLGMRALDGHSWLPMVGVFALGVVMHLQVLLLLPAVALVPPLSASEPRNRRRALLCYTVTGVIGLSAVTWLTATEPALQALILPLSKGWPNAPGYTIASLPHLADLLNEVLFVLPSVIVLAVLWMSGGRWIKRDRISLFLGAGAIGGTAYLLLYGAAVTMARDWDVMSLGLLPILVFVLYQVGGKGGGTSSRAVAAFVAVTLLLTAAMLSLNLRVEPTERRFATLLNDHNRSYWWVFANHFYEKGDTASYQEVVTEMQRRFPEYQHLSEGYRLLERGEIGPARDIAVRLVRLNPLESNFLQFLGNVYRKARMLDSAEAYYRRSLELQPYRAEVHNELGQLYLMRKDYRSALEVLRRAHDLALDRTAITEGLALAYHNLGYMDSALALADTLFMADPHSPGGHLIRLVNAIAAGDMTRAEREYRQYVAYGSGRSDYESIREYYGEMFQ